MKKILSLMLFFVLISTYAFAQEELSVNYDVGTRVVTIDGISNAEKGSLITVIVQDADKKSNYINETEVGENLTFNFRYTLSDTSLGGLYNVYVTGFENGAVKKATFFYPNATLVTNTLNSLNALATADAVRDFISNETNMLVLKLPITGYYSNISNKENVLEKLIHKNFNNITNVIIEFDKAVALQAINEASSSNIAIVITNEAVCGPLSIIFDGAYNNVIDKNAVLNSMVNKNFATYALATSWFAEKVAVQLVSEARWDAIEQLLKDSTLNLNFSIFNNLSSNGKTVVLKEIADANFSDLTSLTSVWNNAIDKQYKSENNTTISGSKGGGSSNISVTTQIVTPQPFIPAATNSTEKDDTENKPNDVLTGFTDLGDVEWADESIKYLFDKKIISGIGNNQFGPQYNITREEFVKMLVGGLNILNENSVADFSDVNKGDWCYKYVASAYENDIIKGNADGAFGKAEFITRQDMSVMLYRALNYMGAKLEKYNESEHFADDELIDNYAKEAVYTLRQNIIINGYEDNNFLPLNNATRAQVAKMMYASIKLLQN